LCEQALIGHCTTSHDHPKVDGLVKKGCVNNQNSFVKMWFLERTFGGLGPLVVVVGYELRV